MSAVDELETAIVGLDADGRIQLLNGSAEQCLATNRSRLQGMAFDQLEGLPPALSSAVSDTRQDRRTRRLHECRMAGGQYDCSIRLLPDDGAAAGVP